jgi:capping protein alpha
VETHRLIYSAAVDEEATKYVNDHYPEGVLTVYTNEQQLILAIVDNKYNPNNYWNGRWRAVWTYDTQSGELKGTTKVTVHYYEDGNVQLNADKEFQASITKNEVNLNSVYLSF